MAYTDKTYDVWILDTGASYHITADFSHIHDPVRCHVGLTVGSGRIMHAMHRGNLWLDIEVSGHIISITLTNVLYVPDWNEACLISLRKIDEIRMFRMIREDGVIEVRKKSDNSVVISAALEHGSYQVYRIMKHGKIYSASIEYWHKALGHTSTPFWNTATDIYGDGSLLPKRSTSLFCPTCAKYNCKQSIPTTSENTKTSVPFDLVHSDLMGPFKVESLGKLKYMLTFFENTTRYAKVHFLYKKSDATRFIKAFCEKVKTSTE